jgi:integrase
LATGRDQVSGARTKTEAKRLNVELQLREDRAREGLEPLRPSDGGGSVDELLEWWMDTYLKAAPSYEKSVGTVRQHLLDSELAHLRLVDVTPGRVELLLQKRSPEVKPRTLNHVRGYLSRAFNAAIETGKFVGANPVANVKRRKVPRRVPQYLKAEEVPAVLAALAPKWRSLFAAALYTGMRKGELLGLRKIEVDLGNRLLTVDRSYERDTTKGGHADPIPIAKDLVPYLAAAMDSSPSDLVFPDEKGRMMSERTQLAIVLRRALRRAGIVTGFRHVCRRKVRPRRAGTRRGTAPVPQVQHEALADRRSAPPALSRPAAFDGVAADDGRGEPGGGAANPAPHGPSHHDRSVRSPRARLSGWTASRSARHRPTRTSLRRPRTTRLLHPCCTPMRRRRAAPSALTRSPRNHRG